MKLIDLLLSLLIPTLILVDLLLAPYTKVEESFNIQATHDILVYSTPTHDIRNRLSSTYDHFKFPGAVPRTFVGAVLLSGISNPIITVLGFKYAQLVVRAVLGLFNAFALLKYKSGLEKAFGKNVGRWYAILQAGQFHVIYYASRTLPNMFAFGLTTLAFCQFLPITSATEKVVVEKRHRLGIYLLILAGVIFRSEIAILLFTQLGYILLASPDSFRQVVKAVVQSAIIALAISVPIDSYFWQRPVWPELAGFYYNAILGKSADWGTSPYHYYFTSGLPRLLGIPVLLVPVSLLQIQSFKFHTERYVARSLAIPSLLFIALYSLQPHKETRFIVYVAPPLTACAALSANYIWTRRSKNELYRLTSPILLAAILSTFAASTIMLGVSSLNYPGGDALHQLHKIIEKATIEAYVQGQEPILSAETPIKIHMDVLSCMTGVTRFQQYLFPSSPAFPPAYQDRVAFIQYDKTEDQETLLLPEFWDQFDYVLAEFPEKVIGKWEAVGTVWGYSGMERVKPGIDPVEGFDSTYAVNNARKSEDVGEAVEGQVVGRLRKFNSPKGPRTQSRPEAMGTYTIYKKIREKVMLMTGGWWIGPKMAPAIWILKRVEEPPSIRSYHSTATY